MSGMLFDRCEILRPTNAQRTYWSLYGSCMCFSTCLVVKEMPEKKSTIIPKPNLNVKTFNYLRVGLFLPHCAKIIHRTAKVRSFVDMCFLETKPSIKLLVLLWFLSLGPKPSIELPRSSSFVVMENLFGPKTIHRTAKVRSFDDIVALWAQNNP